MTRIWIATRTGLTGFAMLMALKTLVAATISSSMRSLSTSGIAAR